MQIPCVVAYKACYPSYKCHGNSICTLHGQDQGLNFLICKVNKNMLIDYHMFHKLDENSLMHNLLDVEGKHIDAECFVTFNSNLSDGRMLSHHIYSHYLATDHFSHSHPHQHIHTAYILVSVFPLQCYKLDS